MDGDREVKLLLILKYNIIYFIIIKALEIKEVNSYKYVYNNKA